MFLETEKIGFRQIEKEDLPKLRDWRNQYSIRKRTREYIPLNMLNQERWFESLINRDNIMFAIINKETKELIGLCGLCHIDRNNRIGEFSYYTGESGDYSKWLSDVIYLLFGYGFEELNLNRITSETYTIAPELIKAQEDIGLVKEGTLRESYFCEGKYWDSWLGSVLAKDFPKIKNSLRLRAEG